MPTFWSLFDEQELVCLSFCSRIQRIDEVWVVEVNFIWIDAHDRTLRCLCQLLQTSAINDSYTCHILYAFRSFVENTCHLERFRNISRINMSLLDSISCNVFTRFDSVSIMNWVFSSVNFEPEILESECNVTEFFKSILWKDKWDSTASHTSI